MTLDSSHHSAIIRATSGARLDVASYFLSGKLVEKSNWWAFLCYPVFLVVGLASIVISKSISSDELFLLELMKNIVKKKVLDKGGKNNQNDKPGQ